MLYKLRWRIALFFRWIKGHLRIQQYYGTSPKSGEDSAKNHANVDLEKPGPIIFCNLVYNIARTEQIIRLKLLGRKTPGLC